MLDSLTQCKLKGATGLAAASPIAGGSGSTTFWVLSTALEHDPSIPLALVLNR